MFDIMPFERNNNRTVFNPFKELNELEKAFFGNNSIAEFKTDIRDTGSAYELEADLPGFKKEDIHIDLEGDYLTISASRNDSKEEKDEKGNYVRRERCYGSFTRSFDISGIKSDEITAEYSDGVLKLNMPKREEIKPTSRRLELK
ncbi:MAG: Hsp20/alpha crystallin family protein [Firmicutes bacterium]|nr:Hsp20/alpha crystallin family protein [Bacillota bacterium]